MQKVNKIDKNKGVYFYIKIFDTTNKKKEKNIMKIYYDEYGYDCAFHVEGNKIYYGEYGYDCAYHKNGKKIYHGEYGYDCAFHTEY